jgi:hypothetical protein
MAMSEFIKKFRCFFEIVSPAKGWFYIYYIKVTTAKTIERQEQLFPLIYRYAKPQPIQKVEKKCIRWIN